MKRCVPSAQEFPQLLNLALPHRKRDGLSDATTWFAHRLPARKRRIRKAGVEPNALPVWSLGHLRSLSLELLQSMCLRPVKSQDSPTRKHPPEHSAARVMSLHFMQGWCRREPESWIIDHRSVAFLCGSARTAGKLAQCVLMVANLFARNFASTFIASTVRAPGFSRSVHPSGTIARCGESRPARRSPRQGLTTLASILKPLTRCRCDLLEQRWRDAFGIVGLLQCGICRAVEAPIELVLVEKR